MSATLLYGRVSTDHQQTEQQEVRCRKYCELHGLDIEAEFSDRDVSGSVAMWDRPGGGRLRHYILDHPGPRHLVALKIDRIGRNTIDILKAVEFLDHHQVTLHIVDFGGSSLTTMGPMGRMLLVVLAGLAEMELEMIRSRVRDRLNLKRAKGELCGTVPYGWNAEPTGEFTPKGIPIRRLVDNPEEQQWILIMHHRRASGLSYQAIARFLNANNVPTKNAGRELPAGGGKTFLASNRWSAGKVQRILNSRTVRDWLAAHPELGDAPPPLPEPSVADPSEAYITDAPPDFNGHTLGADLAYLFTASCQPGEDDEPADQQVEP